ncbi:MAG TPA: hypothetical protein VK176_06875 [Phycisphaerales bacterium]|nr:hypothetical protein [Phycisphaerales bacterium]
MRILHLLSAFDPAMDRICSFGSVLTGDVQASPADVTALACRSLIEKTPGADHTVVCIGGDRALSTLRRLGLTPSHHLSRPGGFSGPARRALRHILTSRGRFSCIQVWDPSLMDLVPHGFYHAPPPSLDDQAALIAAAHPPPAVDVQDELAPAGDHPLILFGADPADAGDAASLFRVIGLSDKSDLRFALIMPRGVRGARRAIRLHRDARIASPLILSRRSAIDWAPIARVVLTVAVKDPREVLFRAFAGLYGVPVVTAPAHDTESLGEPSLIEYFAPAATMLRRILDGEYLPPPPQYVPISSVIERRVHCWHDAACRDLPAPASV